MATQARTPPPRWTFDRVLPDRALAAGALVLLGVVLVAIARGQPHWGDLAPNIWVHLATILLVLVLTPVNLIRPKGDRPHRIVGWVWCLALFGTAALSFDIRLINRGGLSPIHILSLLTMIQVPRIVLAARRHDIRAHRSGIRFLVLGALLIAGFFTFPFGRELGNWLTGTGRESGRTAARPRLTHFPAAPNRSSPVAVSRHSPGGPIVRTD